MNPKSLIALSDSIEQTIDITHQIIFLNYIFFSLHLRIYNLLFQMN